MFNTWQKRLVCGAAVLALVALAAGATRASAAVAFTAIPSPEGSANMTPSGAYRLPASEQTVLTRVSAAGVPAKPGGMTSDTLVFSFSVANNSKHTLSADPSVARIDDLEEHEVLGASAFSGAEVINDLVVPPGSRKFFRLEFSVYRPMSVVAISHLRLVWPFEFGDQCFMSDFYFAGPLARFEEPGYRERVAPGAAPGSPGGPPDYRGSGWLPAGGSSESLAPAPPEPAPIYLYPYRGWQVPIYPCYGYLWGYFPGFRTLPWTPRNSWYGEQREIFLAPPPPLSDRPIYAVPTQLAPPLRR